MSRRSCTRCAAALFISLALAGPLPAQAPAAPRSTLPAARLAPPALPSAPDPAPSPGAEPRPDSTEPRLAASLSTEREAAPPSTADFVYQVLLIVVSAVVTAVVWKAIN